MDVRTAALILSAILNAVCGQSPVLSVRPRTAAVKLGETVSFHCRVTSGSQPVQLEWKRINNQPLGDNVKLGPDGAVLTIANVRLNNQGGYRCIATNAQGKSSITATLSIRQPPKVRVTPSGPLTVRAGESVTLECNVSGKPRPSVSWFKQEGGSETELVSTTTDTTTSLQVTVMGAEDAGIFVCRAQSREGLAEGRVKLELEGGASAPQASVSDTDLTAVAGQSITMNCEATGSPAPVISWSKLRAPLPWQHKVSGGSLILSNVGRQDSGQYICNATNAAGFSEAYVQLEVDCLFLLACESRECGDGFDKINKECVDVDECETPNLCGNNSQCINTVGSYFCTCDEGFQSKTPNFTAETTEQCQDINECFEKPPVCSDDMVCVNTPGSYNCSCPEGYRETRLESLCEDIDECEDPDVCGTNSVCYNLPGGYGCKCDQGYSNYDNDQSKCIDIDECEDPDVCGTNGVCYNLPGRYSCKCHQGYSDYDNDQSKCIEMVRFCE